MELLIDHVSKRFKDKKAVNDISLELTPGVWGLLGANGAGKTTLMRMIAGIMQPTSGQVVYDGVPIQELGEQYRSIFGFLPQDFGFYPDFTVYDYLLYIASIKGLRPLTARERAGELMKFYQDDSIREIFDISGGDIANEILPYLDYEAIAGSGKRFWGYSDLTTVINAIGRKSGKESVLYQVKHLVGAHGETQQNAFETYLFQESEELTRFSYQFVQKVPWRE